MTKADLAVTVYERSEQLVASGAGITLRPNARVCSIHLDIGPALERRRCAPRWNTGTTARRRHQARD